MLAANAQVVKRRIDDYLWRSRTPSMEALRAFVQSEIMTLGAAAIVGGLVRDFALGGRRGFHSDVDIVIDAPEDQVTQLGKRLRAIENRFGGFCYKSDFGKVDFWALETTWAHKCGYVNVGSISDITRSTFFDCDSVLYDLGSRQVTADAQYFDRLKARTIEINLAETPSTNGNLLRAIRRMFFWDLCPGPRLKEFLSENLNDKSFLAVGCVEKELYAQCIIPKFNNYAALLSALCHNSKRSEFYEAWRKPTLGKRLP